MRAEARRLRLAEEKAWLRLLHYRSALGGWKSEVDGRPFFLAPDGRRDPHAELEATLEAFFAPPPLPAPVSAPPGAAAPALARAAPGVPPPGPLPASPGGASPPAPGRTPAERPHARCQFPARWRWLADRLAIDAARLPDVACPAWEEFRDRLDARSATLVFSSYYLNNPSSAFGHTFIRLNKAQPASAVRSDLLDYGVDYAAVVTTSNAVLYAALGLFGGFEGRFSHYPYYYKVRQYNDYETRDLWEYDLDLTARQVETLVAHFWELGSTWFDYYYLNENCSYHMLTVLEAANPDLDLVEQVPWWVIPADTVKALYRNPGLVKAVRYRPSLWTQFRARVAGLGPAERRLVREAAAGRLERLPPDMPPADRIAVLDAAQDYFDFLHAEALLREDADAASRKRVLLAARSQVRQPSPPLRLEPPFDRMPQRGHDSLRVGLAAGYSDRLGHFQRADLRFALHDLTDPEAGYPDFAQIEFLSTRVRYNADRGSFWLEQLDVVRVVSLAPVDDFVRQLSWKVGFGARTVRDEACRDCLAGSFDLGGGYAVSLLGRPRTTAFLMGDVEALAAPDLEDRRFRLGVGPLAGLHVRVGERVSLLASGTWKHLVDYEPDRTYSAGLTAKVHLSRRVSLGLEGARVPSALEGALGVLVYF